MSSKDLSSVVRGLLRYSLGEVGSFQGLTKREQTIIGDEETFDELRMFVGLEHRNEGSKDKTASQGSLDQLADIILKREK